MKIKTTTGSRFDTERPVFSNLFTILDNRGRKIREACTLTGNVSEVKKDINGEFTELEVSHSLGTSFVSEEYLFQN